MWFLYLRLGASLLDPLGRALALGIAFAMVQTIAIAGLMTTAQIMKTRKRIADKRAARVRPLIGAALGRFVAGGSEAERRELARFFGSHFHELEECLLESLASIAGTGHERLVQLAIDLGFVQAWRKKTGARNADRRRDAIQKLGLVMEARGQDALLAALSDENLAVRMEAARALVRQGGPESLEPVFETLHRQQLLFRAILIEDLERHSFTLCARAIPAALCSEDVSRVRGCLEVLAAWQRALPLPDLPKLLESPDPELRAGAIAVLPLAFDFPSPAAAVLRALEDPDPRVQAAAAGAAAKLKIAGAVPHLSHCLNTERPEAAHAAARALAEFGPSAWSVLESAIVAGAPVVAAAAVEALERARLQPAGSNR